MAETGFGFPKSKNFATSLSNIVVTPDEILPKIFTTGLEASVTVDEKVWSMNRSSESSRIHGLEDMVAFACLGENIYDGELIGMGTIPSCCGLEVNKWLKPGNTIKLSVESLGTLTNTIKARDPWPEDMKDQICFKHLNYGNYKKSDYLPLKVVILSILIGLILTFKEKLV